MATAKKAVTPSASSTGPGPVRGPASYFPSIEKKAFTRSLYFPLPNR